LRGAYIASPGGNKVCFALAKPKTTKTKPAGRKRDPSYVFVATRPAENVKNEVSVIIGYSFKTSSDATAEVGTEKFAMWRLPSIFGWKPYVEAGGMMSYGPILPDNFARLAVFVDKILKGARPADLALPSRRSRKADATRCSRFPTH
jgi:hypothetical protein